MRLSKLYTNRDELFQPITFNRRLNVVLAEIRLPQNRNKDTHNLGKSTLGLLIDFVLLSKKSSRGFLFKHLDVFESFVFFLELELSDSSYITIRRSVESASKISFKKHQSPGQNFSNWEDEEWDHLDIPFEKAKELLDALLDLRGLKPWGYRKLLGYLIRRQEDYRDTFQLRRFAGKHLEWKPFLAQILGFDAEILASHYEKEEQLASKKEREASIRSELGESVLDISQVEGLLLLKRTEATGLQTELDSFDFRKQDKITTERVVERIDRRIGELNSERYYLDLNLKKIETSIDRGTIMFKPDEAAKVFNEAGVLFDGQLKKDFEQLLAFNVAITKERKQFLEEERDELRQRLASINNELNALGDERRRELSYLSETDIFIKYKLKSENLVQLRADILALERQKTFIQKLQRLKNEVRALGEEIAALQVKIELDVEKQNSDPSSLFSKIRLYFNEVVERVVARKALLSVSANQYGHLEFTAEILDEAGNATSADLGFTYRKLLCIAFDLAILRSHLGEQFPRFVYHDGVFESLDDRKKENLLEVLRDYTRLGIQSVITLIDSDLPSGTGSAFFDSAEIVLTLHDEDETGRLFKMDTW